MVKIKLSPVKESFAQFHKNKSNAKKKQKKKQKIHLIVYSKNFGQ